MLKKLLLRWSGIPIQVKASVSYTICNILQKSLSFITLPLFTRLLTTEQYGQYSVYASWSAILTIFITLYLSSGSFSKAMVKFEDARERYLASVQNITVLLAVVFLAVFFWKFTLILWGLCLVYAVPSRCYMDENSCSCANTAENSCYTANNYRY